MKYLKYLLIFSTLFFFSSCEDFFEQNVTVDIPETPPKISITAIWTKDQDSSLVMVSSSVGALKETQSELIAGATVELYEDGEWLNTFKEKTDVGSYYPTIALDLKPGKTYKLTVSADNFESVSATQIMPDKPEITSAIYREDDKLSLKFIDEPSPHFYVLAAKSTNTQYELHLESAAGFTEENGLNYSDILMTDANFDGTEFHQVFDTYYSPSSETDSIDIYLSSVSQDYYQFARTLAASINAEFNPFSEPVILHRNIKNGFGVFALGNTRQVRIPYK